MPKNVVHEIFHHASSHQGVSCTRFKQRSLQNQFPNFFDSDVFQSCKELTCHVEIPHLLALPDPAARVTEFYEVQTGRDRAAQVIANADPCQFPIHSHPQAICRVVDIPTKSVGDPVYGDFDIPFPVQWMLLASARRLATTPQKMSPAPHGGPRKHYIIITRL